MSQLYLVDRFLRENHSESSRQNWYTDITDVDSGFFQGPFYRTNVMSFLASYREWLQELEFNRRGFKPFHAAGALDSFLNRDGERSKSWFGGSPKYSDIDDKMNRFSNSNTAGSPEERLVKGLHAGTKAFLKDRFSIQ
jgi:hypothetical protein